MLGLEVQDLDEQIPGAHGETVRETANMISFMADVIGIRDDINRQGNAYMREVSQSVRQGYKDGVLEQIPVLVNLQCDIDHPTQCMADMLHIIHHWRRGKPQGQKNSHDLGLFSLLWQTLVSAPGSHWPHDPLWHGRSPAHPEGYEVMPEVEEVARKQAVSSGGSFAKTNSMAEAFADADLVYPRAGPPCRHGKRTDLYGAGDFAGIDALEKELLAQNARHKDWCCTEELMKTTRDGKALYLHCLPADISGVSCEEGEVAASVFDRYRTPLYKQASYKPYIIAAMIFLAKCQNPQDTLQDLYKRGTKRWLK